MSAKLQSSLLRVLQEHTFTRLGSTELRSSDFRLICATNKRMVEEVKAGRFREDLFYRINVVPLHLPLLSQRRQDIVPLAIHFLAHFNAKFDKDVGPLTPDAIRLMERFPWPGNVRQLQHAIERIVALHVGGPISPVDLEQVIQAPGALDKPEQRALLSYVEERETFERDYLTRLLDDAGGNVSEAARLSGISRQNLYVRMKRWGIVPES